MPRFIDDDDDFALPSLTDPLAGITYGEAEPVAQAIEPEVVEVGGLDSALGAGLGGGPLGAGMGAGVDVPMAMAIIPEWREPNFAQWVEDAGRPRVLRVRLQVYVYLPPTMRKARNGTVEYVKGRYQYEPELSEKLGAEIEVPEGGTVADALKVARYELRERLEKVRKVWRNG